jgi:arylsulfatase A
MKYKSPTLQLGSWFLLIALTHITLSQFASVANCKEKTSKPNIIIILADDLGYDDTSLFGGWVKTPQIERMAKEGLTFTDFHANSSVCSPTRAALMTGRYQQRVGIVDVVARHLKTPSLMPSELSMPRLLKNAGYRTALYGKWHLGSKPESNPIHHGFDEFRGYLPGYVDYHAHQNSWYNGLKKEDQKGYVTHIVTDNAVKFIRDNKDKPFFLYVSHEAVHLPFQTPDDTLENRKPIPKDKLWSRDRIRPKYKIMLEKMDKGIGQILDTVNETGISKNTLVFFLSDNGAIGAGSNKPFRGGKFSHYEGGHRVPAIAWWPGKIKAGAKTEQLAVGMDLLPTFADIAGLPIPKQRKLDGTSIKSIMFKDAKDTKLADRKVFFGYEPKLGTAMRDGNWKMIVRDGNVKLFNLSKDISESKNIAADHPGRTKSMQAQIEAFKKEVAWEPK